MPNAWDNGLRVNIRNTVDTSKIQKLAKKAAVNILVGFPSGRQHAPNKNEDGGNNKDVKPIENAELAKMLHFGTATIPARPFLDDGINSKKDEILDVFRKEAKKAIDGGSANWNLVGVLAVGAVQEFVRGDYYKTNVPNSKKTIENKNGGDTPLIDTADLINSLAFVVNDGDVNVVTKKGEVQSLKSEEYNAADFRS